MPKFKYGEHDIYYEDTGEGEPLLILNGIFMSCASWAAFIPAFTKSNRLLLLDFIDQGKSDKVNHEYSQDIQVEVALALLDELGLPAVNIAGISYGGEIAMKIAINHPDRVKKLILANTTAYTSAWLRDIGRSWEYSFASYDGHMFFKTCIPIIYSPRYYEENYEWLAKREDLFVKIFTPEVYDAFGRLTRSAENHDERAELPRIEAPTLVISSDSDFVTPFFHQEELARLIPKAGHVTIENAGHASMYEKPGEFVALLLGFINSETEHIAIA
ncbi:MAG: alpha/beta hydrolase [Clostridiales Family XIII bacterium]|jgi:pimeloyl-ACP methyl ester carboxylesterase|nr:alpha/beta hydrolase [Clostridiales Family XIII bacterium]